MYHQGTVRGSAVRAASLLALAGAGLFGLAATAGATVATGTTGAIPVTYACSLAAYGQGLAPLNVPAALSAESTGLTVTVKLVTQPVPVPAATASALPQLSYLDIAGTASANGMSGRAVNLSGQSGYLGTVTQLPAMTATGSATQTGSGPAAVEVPPTLTLTPVGSASQTQQAPLTCTTSSATTVQVTAATGATARRYSRHARAGVHVHGDGRHVHHDRQPGPDELDRDGTGHRRHAGHGDALRAREHARLGVSRQRLADVRVGRGGPGRNGCGQRPDDRAGGHGERDVPADRAVDAGGGGDGPHLRAAQFRGAVA